MPDAHLFKMAAERKRWKRERFDKYFVKARGRDASAIETDLTCYGTNYCLTESH